MGQLSGPNVIPTLHGATHLIGGHTFESAVVVDDVVTVVSGACVAGNGVIVGFAV